MIWTGLKMNEQAAIVQRKRPSEILEKYKRPITIKFGSLEAMYKEMRGGSGNLHSSVYELYLENKKMNVNC